MKKKGYSIIILIFVSIFFSGTAFSQKNYLPGYIINAYQDTLRGLIDYRNWDQNPEFIRFKKDSADNEQSYGMMDIQNFVVADEIYVSAIIDKMDIQNFSGILQYDANIKLKKDTVFLQTLVRGGKDLLYLKDKDGIEQFYIHTGSSYELLKYKKYIKENGGSISYAKNKSYVGQLVLSFSDCSIIQGKVKDLEYNKTDLIKLFAEYYKCANKEVKFERKNDHLKVLFGCLAGIAHTSVEAKSIYNYLGDVPLTSSTTFAAGLTFDLVLSRNLGKWAVAEELLYTSYLSEGHYDRPSIPATIELGFSHIKINNMVRYRIPVGKFNIFFNAGISFAIGVHETNVYHDESIFQHPDRRALMDVRGGELGYLLGTGAEYKHFSLQARYEYSNGFSAYQDLATPTKRWYVLAGYTF